MFEGSIDDVDGDDIDDLLTTIATQNQGAALQVCFIKSNGSYQSYDESEFIELSNQWLHQLAVAPMESNGKIEVVEIRMPHIDGKIQYY